MGIVGAQIGEGTQKFREVKPSVSHVMTVVRFDSCVCCHDYV